MKDEKRIHHGLNIRLARTWKNMTQEALADKLNVYQTDISDLEKKEIVDDELLDKVAKAMDIPVDFFKEFELGNTMNTYNVYDNENSQGDIMGQKIVEREENTYYPLDKVTELYERLLKEKELQIEELKAKLK